MGGWARGTLAAVVGLVVAGTMLDVAAASASEIGFDGNGVELVGADGEDRRRVSGSDRDSQPAWSADGTKLAFSSTRGDRRDDPASDLYVVGADGSGRRRLTRTALSEYTPAFAPDGREIAFSRTERARSLGASLFVVSLAGGAPRRLTTAPRRGFDREPDFSPDGTRLAFSRFRFDPRKGFVGGVYVAGADGSEPRLIQSDASSPAWSPDGTSIAFVSYADRNGQTCFQECSPNGEIYVARPDGGGMRRLTETTSDEGSPDWSPNGERLAFSSDRSSPESYNDEIYVMDSSGRCATRITNSSTSNTDPTWRPVPIQSPSPPPEPCPSSSGGGARPRSDVDLGPARRFKGFSLLYLGESFEDLLLSDAEPGSFIYDDCARDDGRCGPSVQVQVRSVCERHPLVFGFKGGTPPGLEDFEVFAQRRFRYRGALVVVYGPDTVDIHSGGITVSVFGAEGARLLALIRSLRPLSGPPSLHRPLSPPAFPASVRAKLRRFTDLRRRLGSVGAVARKLRVSKATVRDRLALDRDLRAFGSVRPTRCR